MRREKWRGTGEAWVVMGRMMQADLPTLAALV